MLDPSRDTVTIQDLKRSRELHPDGPLRCLIDDDAKWLKIKEKHSHCVVLEVQHFDGSWRSQDVHDLDDAIPIRFFYDDQEMRFLGLRDGLIRLGWPE